jgi:hypothetical protein
VSARHAARPAAPARTRRAAAQACAAAAFTAPSYCCLSLRRARAGEGRARGYDRSERSFDLARGLAQRPGARPGRGGVQHTACRMTRTPSISVRPQLKASFARRGVTRRCVVSDPARPSLALHACVEPPAAVAAWLARRLPTARLRGAMVVSAAAAGGATRGARTGKQAQEARVGAQYREDPADGRQAAD